MSFYTRDYDSENYNPAAPVVEIGVPNAGSNKPALSLTALVDSGADATMLPIDILQAAAARYATTMRMRGVSGQPVMVELYLVTLFVGSVKFPGIEAIAAPENTEAILGRDALNQMIVTLNGLAGIIEISQ